EQGSDLELRSCCAICPVGEHRSAARRSVRSRIRPGLSRRSNLCVCRLQGDEQAAEL
ncbi:MAG: hypothetical protein AVDCRST_MAG62-1936, partial [uncultured Sphingomonas sp.]